MESGRRMEALQSLGYHRRNHIAYITAKGSQFLDGRGPQYEILWIRRHEECLDFWSQSLVHDGQLEFIGEILDTAYPPQQDPAVELPGKFHNQGITDLYGHIGPGPDQFLHKSEAFFRAEEVVLAAVVGHNDYYLFEHRACPLYDIEVAESRRVERTWKYCLDHAAYHNGV